MRIAKWISQVSWGWQCGLWCLAPSAIIGFFSTFWHDRAYLSFSLSGAFQFLLDIVSGIGGAFIYSALAVGIWFPVLLVALGTGAAVLATGPRGLVGRVVFTVATAVTATAWLPLWILYSLGSGTVRWSQEVIPALVTVMKYVSPFALLGPWFYYPRKQGTGDVR